jgi:hypothetical protein
MMSVRLRTACLFFLIACHHEPSLAPSVRVTGELDGPGAFAITIPTGYTMDPMTTTGPIRRWTRGPNDPTIELDATAWKEHSSCVRKSTDKSVGVLGGVDHIVLCNNGTGVYISDFEEGDDPLDCYVTYPREESLGSVRAHEGAAICESVVVDHHRLTAAPHVLRAHATKRVRLDVPSGGFANVELLIPARYNEKRFNQVLFEHASGGSLPAIFLFARPGLTTCESFPATKSNIEVPEGIGICDDGTTMYVFSSVQITAEKNAQCQVVLPMKFATAGSQESALPKDVMSQRVQDAVAICKSMKLIDYQKPDNRRE